MNDMERRTFEDSFKDAFRGAGMSPTESVWTNIELDLERAEGKKMKRRVFFYKMLAAASVTFALGVAGIGYYTMTSKNALNSSPESQLAQLNPTDSPAERNGNLSQNPHSTPGATQQQPRQSTTDTQQAVQDRSTNTPLETDTFLETTGAVEAGQATNKKTGSPLEKATAEPGTTTSINLNHHAANDAAVYTRDVAALDAKSSTDYGHSDEKPNSIAAATPDDKGRADLLPPGTGAGTSTVSRERELPALYTARVENPAFKKETSEADPVALMFAKLADLERALASQGTRKEQTNHEKLWTSVGFAAGGFNAVNPSVSPTSGNNTMAAGDTKVASEQAKASGVAYSMGVSFGTQVSSRWVIQGGLNYMTQESDYTANQAVGSLDFQNFKAASLNEFRASNDATDKIVATAPYSVNNSVRFISVPMQAGYLVVNRKVALQLNAGVSTDLFLQNTIDPEGGGLERTTQGRGDDSPYRSFNFSGLFGTELSYRFSDRYRVALNPGLRYPFNSIYKTDSGVDSTPLTFDLGLRFRYIFK